MFWSVLLAVETKLHPEDLGDEKTREWQGLLIDTFLESISGTGKAHIAEIDPPNGYCQGWSGITCENGIMVKIKYCNMAFGNFNVHVLPPTVQFLQLFQCKQKYSIHTRQLPRDAKTIWLHKNRLYGHIDLTTLPVKLDSLSLWENNLEGPIVLTQLPSSMTNLMLSRNKIKQDVVFYANLPPNIQMIEFNHIGERRPVNRILALDSNQKAEKSIFHGIPKNRID